MTQNPTGVFVRLPLNEEQIIKLYNPKQSGNENLLSIGTPVTGADLDPSRDSFEAFYSQMCTKATGCAGVNPDYVRGLRSGDGYGYRTFLNNVWEAWPEFIDFAQAQLAARDAEIVRLREALVQQKTFHESEDKSLSKQPPSSQGSWRRNQHQEQLELIDEALKGGAA